MAAQIRPIDPDVKLPGAVRRAALLSEQFYQSQEGEGQPQENQSTQEAEAQNQTDQNNEGVGEAEQIPAPDKIYNQAEHKTQQREERARARSRVRAASQEPQEGPEHVEAQTTQHATQPADEWERKYNAMKGRYDRSEAQVNQLSQQVAGLQNVLATMQAPPPAAPSQQSQTSTQQIESLLTPEEREQYGDEFLSVVAKKANEVVGPLKKELESKLKQLDAQLNNVGQHVDRSTKDSMFARLDQQIPDWRDINNDPNFVQWLQLPDHYSGAIRHRLLMDAFNQNQTDRVAAFFNGFLAEEAATAPQGQPRDQGAPAAPSRGQPQQPQRTSLETLAAPGRAKTAAAQAPVEKPIFTRAQIAAFYTNIAAGKYDGRDKEKDKLEAQIFSAQQEGRIRN